MGLKFDENEGLREGRWCLKYGRWIKDIAGDSFFDGSGCPECTDCPYQAWNIIERGLPIDGMPFMFYFNDKWEMTKSIQECSHGNLFLKHPHNPLNNEYGWMKLVDFWWLVETKCICKSPKGDL